MKQDRIGVSLHSNVFACSAANLYAVGKGSFGEVYKGYHINPPIATPARTHLSRHSASTNGRGKP